MIIAKFGGSSLRDADRIKYISQIVADIMPHKPVVVLSAIGDTTDMLLKLSEDALRQDFDCSALIQYHLDTAQKLGVSTTRIEPLFIDLQKLLEGVSLLKEFTPRAKDYLLSFGERLSVRIVSEYMGELGIACRSFDGWEAGILTDSNFNEAEVLVESHQRVNENLKPLVELEGITPIVTGFIAKDRSGNITTLGRGGSDLSATFLGAALNVKEIQIWKDVDGILSTDPRLVDSPKQIPFVSFEEASELAFFGAKVLHPLSLRPAMEKNIPVRIKNSYNKSHEGSVIVRELIERNGSLVKAITVKDDVTLVDIVSTRMLGQYGFLAKVFSVFEKHQVSVDMVATSEVSVSLTINHNRKSEVGIQKVIEELVAFARVTAQGGKSIVSLICEIEQTSDIMAGAFATLKEQGIQVQMISQGASKVNIGLVVESGEAGRALTALHDYFFPKRQTA